MTTANATQPPHPTPALINTPAMTTSGDFKEWIIRELSLNKTLIEIPGWVIHVRQSSYARVKGWWTTTRDCGINHQARPVLLYRIGGNPWRAVLALRDLHQDLSDLHQNLSMETNFEGLVTVLERTPGLPPLSRSADQ